MHAFTGKNTRVLHTETLEPQTEKIPAKRSEKTPNNWKCQQKHPRNRKQNYPQMHTNLHAIAGNLVSHRVLIHQQIAGKLPSTSVLYDALSRVFCVMREALPA